MTTSDGDDIGDGGGGGRLRRAPEGRTRGGGGGCDDGAGRMAHEWRGRDMRRCRDWWSGQRREVSLKPRLPPVLPVAAYRSRSTPLLARGALAVASPGRARSPAAGSDSPKSATSEERRRGSEDLLQRGGRRSAEPRVGGEGRVLSTSDLGPALTEGMPTAPAQCALEPVVLALCSAGWPRQVHARPRAVPTRLASGAKTPPLCAGAIFSRWGTVDDLSAEVYLPACTCRDFGRMSPASRRSEGHSGVGCGTKWRQKSLAQAAAEE